MKTTIAGAVAHRTVLVMTCWVCGDLKPGSLFERRARKHGQRAYLDRRCQPCRWAHLERSPGRDKHMAV